VTNNVRLVINELIESECLRNLWNVCWAGWRVHVGHWRARRGASWQAANGHGLSVVRPLSGSGISTFIVKWCQRARTTKNKGPRMRRCDRTDDSRINIYRVCWFQTTNIDPPINKKVFHDDNHLLIRQLHFYEPHDVRHAQTGHIDPQNKLVDFIQAPQLNHTAEHKD